MLRAASGEPLHARCAAQENEDPRTQIPRADGALRQYRLVDAAARARDDAGKRHARARHASDAAGIRRRLLLGRLPRELLEGTVMNAFYEGLAEIFEIDASEVTPALALGEHNWDSLAIVSTIALADDCFGVLLNGQALGNCKTVADIDALVAAQKG
ncbi:putative acyl carrier protein [Burkholderia pseudomallei 406e]|nr:putative acyl carrier protein [Burkholderia pseudomallei 406e]